VEKDRDIYLRGGYEEGFEKGYCHNSSAMIQIKKIIRLYVKIWDWNKGISVLYSKRYRKKCI